MPANLNSKQLCLQDMPSRYLSPKWPAKPNNHPPSVPDQTAKLGMAEITKQAPINIQRNTTIPQRATTRSQVSPENGVEKLLNFTQHCHMIILHPCK